MRFSQRTRRWAIRLAWAGLLVAVALLVGLRLGRPLYYTDGTREVAAGTLTAGGMVRWNTPEAVVELPGPVAGRVAALPDGRLVYGRVTAEGTTDLVVIDPARPLVPPEPAYGLNTAHNELAPAVGADGRIYFASDRPQGIGGYDLYVAPVSAAGFGTPQPLTICNSALDETDPAPHPDGGELVFVRIDRRVADGRGGDLWQVRLDGERDPTPVFPGRKTGRTTVADRDPAFAPGGSALWFVRQEAAAPLQLLRASRLDGRCDAPQPVGAVWGTRDLRAPLPSADGLHLGLLQPRRGDVATDLWLRADAEELPPWWPGQRWLEAWLLGTASVCALLLLLLHLGRRWSALDFVAQCLLLSVLLHALLFLWLMGVEIQGAPLPGDDEQGRLQVMLVTEVAAAAGGGEAPLPADVAARVQFAIAPQPLAVTPPMAAPEATARMLDVAAAAATWQPEAVASTVDASTALQDRGADWDRRSEVAAEVVASAALLPPVSGTATAARAAQAAARAEASAALVAVAAPGVGFAKAAAPTRLLAGAAVVAVPQAGRGAALPPATPVADPAAPMPVRTAAAAPTALTSAPNDVGAAAPAPPAVQRASVAGALLVEGMAPGTTSLPPAAPPLPAPPLLATAAPVAQAHTVAVRMQDATPAGSAVAKTFAGASPAPAATAAAPTPVAARALGVAVARPTAGLAVPASAVAPPTALARVAAAAVPAASPPGLVPAGTRTVRTAEVALRDRVTTAPALAPGASTGSAPQPTADAAAAVAAIAPLATQLGAPVRGQANATAVREVEPPGSQLARPAAAPVLVGANTATLPVARPAATGAPGRVRLHDQVAAAAGLAPAVPAPATAGTHPAPVAAPALAAPRGGALLPRASRPGTRPADVPAAAPPGSALVRVRGAVGTAPAPFAARTAGIPRPVPAGAPVHDGSRLAVTRTGSAPAPAGVSAVAVVVDRAPVQWPTPRRSSLGNPPVAAPMPVAPPPSLLARSQTTATLARPDAPNQPATAYSNRFGPAKAQALETFGGSEATERAVADGLRYLARTQQVDGSWGDPVDFDQKYGRVYVGKTALCVLAFLGAGHTPASHTEHSAVVGKAIDHLLAIQDPDTGAFGASSCYGHGITTYALAECYGLTKAPALLRPLEDALAWILQHQGPRRDRRNRGGWGYFSPGLAAEDDYARVSVTAWMVMALESVRLSGIELPEQVLPRAREFLELSFDARNGWFRYNHEPDRLRSAWPTLPASTPAGAFCLLLLGAEADDAKVRAAVDYTVARRPEQYRPYDDEDFVLRGQGNVYFWYYGSLCCFLAGGEAWQEWNERLRTVLPQAQSADGSFAPIDVYAREAGDSRTDRSYTTAMCVLSLEVYYRYFTPLLLGR